MLFFLIPQARALAVAGRSSAQCSTWGQTHYRTFDGQLFEFLGKCTYALAQDCIPGSDQYAIHVQNDPDCTGDRKPCTRAVVLYVGDTEYRVVTGNTVTVNGEAVALPLQHEFVTITRILSYTVIRALGDDIEIKFDGDSSSIYVALGDRYHNNTCGLCGNHNGVPEDDFMLANSQVQAKNALDFGNSWAMPKHGEACESLNKEPASLCSNVSLAVIEMARRSCMVLLSELFSACHSKVAPQGYVTACEEDMCSCDSRQHSGCVCEVLTQYSRTCASRGVTLAWRNEALCRKYLVRVCVCVCVCVCLCLCLCPLCLCLYVYVPCHAVLRALCCVVLCCVVLCCAVLRCLWCAVRCCILCFTVPVVLCSVSCCYVVVLGCIALHCVAWYYVVCGVVWCGVV